MAVAPSAVADPRQQLVLQALWDLFHAQSRWPLFTELDRYVDQNHDLDAAEVIPAMPPGLLSGLPRTPTPPGGTQLRLTVAGAVLCTGSNEELAVFVAVVRHAAGLDRSWAPPNPTAELILTEAEVRRAVSLPAAGRDAVLIRVKELLTVEQWGWKHAGVGEDGWQFTLDRGVRRFRGLRDITDYCTRQTAATNPPVPPEGPSDTPSSTKIFLSYRREDTQHMAGRLFDRLTDRYGSANVFMDVASIEPGVDFRADIERAVGQCDVLLALIGRSWLSATDEHGQRRLDDPEDLVVLEIKSALDRDIRVIPVLIDDASAPRQVDLPKAVAPLARRNATRLDHATFPTDIGPLINTLDRAARNSTSTASADAGDTDVQPPTQAGPTPKDTDRGGGRRRRRSVIVAIAVAVVVFPAVVWFLATRPTSPVPPPAITLMTDPCSFLAPADLEAFGGTRFKPDYGSLAGCTVTVQAGNEQFIDVRADLDVPLAPDEPISGDVVRRGDLLVATEPCEGECRVTLQLGGGPRVILQARFGDPTAMTEILRAAQDTAERVLQVGPFQTRRPFPDGSIGELAACGLLTPDELQNLIGDRLASEPIAGFGNWTCSWGDDTLAVGIGFDQTTPEEVRAKRTETTIAGRSVFVEPQADSAGRGECLLGIPTRMFTASDGEARVEGVQLVVRGQITSEQACAYADSLAKIVVPRLPSLPYPTARSWSDEFSGSEIDTSKWQVDAPPRVIYQSQGALNLDALTGIPTANPDGSNPRITALTNGQPIEELSFQLTFASAVGNVSGGAGGAVFDDSGLEYSAYVGPGGEPDTIALSMCSPTNDCTSIAGPQVERGTPTQIRILWSGSSIDLYVAESERPVHSWPAAAPPTRAHFSLYADAGSAFHVLIDNAYIELG